MLNVGVFQYLLFPTCKQLSQIRGIFHRLDFLICHRLPNDVDPSNFNAHYEDGVRVRISRVGKPGLSREGRLLPFEIIQMRRQRDQIKRLAWPLGWNPRGCPAIFIAIAE